MMQERKKLISLKRSAQSQWCLSLRFQLDGSWFEDGVKKNKLKNYLFPPKVNPLFACKTHNCDTDSCLYSSYIINIITEAT